MPVDETRYQPPSLEIEIAGMRRRKTVLVITDSNDPAASDQDMTKAQILGREDLSIGKEFQQGMGPGVKKRGVILH